MGCSCNSCMCAIVKLVVVVVVVVVVMVGGGCCACGDCGGEQEKSHYVHY